MTTAPGILRSTVLLLAALAAGPAAPPAPLPAPLPAAREGPLHVLCTVPCYGALARAIGGDLVDVTVLCRPAQDIHSVTATPSTVERIRQADLLFYTGLDAELWLDPMLRSSGNLGLLPGHPGAVVLSDGIPLREVPSKVDRSQGDVHAFGNPHVWTDPLAVRTMAAHVKDALVAALPAQATGIEARHKAFHDRLTSALVDWLTRYRGLKGRKVVVYHRAWAYFLERFGLVEVGSLEPKPRVAPTAAHLAEVIGTMKAAGATVILREPWCAPDAADFVARAVDGQVVEIATHPGFPEGTDDIIDHFEHNLRAIADALGVEAAPRP